MKRVSIFILTLASLTACEVERDLDIKHLDHESRLVVYCMPTAQRDTTVIQVSHSLPINGNYGTSGDAYVTTEGCLIDYKVNGISQEVHALSTNERMGTVPPGRYYVVCPQQAGDHISISVSHEGYPTATAETVIPETVAISEPTVHEVNRIDNDGNRWAYYQLTTQFSDLQTQADYYAVQVEQLAKQHRYDPDSNVELTDTVPEAISINTLDEPLLNTQTEADESFGYDNDYYSNFYHFDDRQLTAQPYTLHLNIGQWGAGTVRIAFYHLSPEYYQFVKSLNDANNNGMAEYGLSTITPTFSNVHGGLGFVGAYAVSYSDWKYIFPADYPYNQ